MSEDSNNKTAKMATNVDTVNTPEPSVDSSKRKDPFSPDDLPATQKQLSRQTKARTLSYSSEQLDKSVDEMKVDQIINRKPGVTFNLPELICAILQDETFVDKLTPKITNAIWEKMENKYDQLINEAVKPLHEKVEKQAELLNAQNVIIKKQVEIVNSLEKKGERTK